MGQPDPVFFLTSAFSQWFEKLPVLQGLQVDLPAEGDSSRGEGGVCCHLYKQRSSGCSVHIPEHNAHQGTVQLTQRLLHPTEHPTRTPLASAAEPHVARSSLPAVSAPGLRRGSWPGAGQAAPSSLLTWGCAPKALQVREAGRHLQNAYCAAGLEARATAHPTGAKEAPAPPPHSAPKHPPYLWLWQPDFTTGLLVHKQPLLQALRSLCPSHAPTKSSLGCVSRTPTLPSEHACMYQTEATGAQHVPMKMPQQGCCASRKPNSPYAPRAASQQTQGDTKAPGMLPPRPMKCTTDLSPFLHLQSDQTMRFPEHTEGIHIGWKYKGLCRGTGRPRWTHRACPGEQPGGSWSRTYPAAGPVLSAHSTAHTDSPGHPNFPRNLTAAQQRTWHNVMLCHEGTQGPEPTAAGWRAAAVRLHLLLAC